MNQITIDISVSRESLVDLITEGGIAQLEDHLDRSPPETTVKLYELNGLVFCQASNNTGVWLWSIASCWCDGEEELEEAKTMMTPTN